MKPHKSYNRERLLTFFEEVDNVLDRNIEIITLGGSALNLLGLKNVTKDIDFFIKGINYHEMEEVLAKLKERYSEKEIDYWEDGKIVLTTGGKIITQELPSDYAEIAQTIETKLNHITVKALNPIDIILTKIGRASDEDIKDITALANKYEISKEKLDERFKRYLKNNDGNKERLQKNFKYVSEIMYGE